MIDNHSLITMELDKRSAHWIVTTSVNAPPLESNIPLLNATYVLAKFNEERKSLSVWYSFRHAQRASTVTNMWDTGDIVIKRVTLEKLDEFKAVASNWQAEPSISAMPVEDQDHEVHSNIDNGVPVNAQLPKAMGPMDDDTMQRLAAFRTKKRKLQDMELALDREKVYLRQRLHLD